MNQLGLAHNDYLQYEYGESGPAAIRMIDRGVKLLRTIDSIQEFADEREFNHSRFLNDTLASVPVGQLPAIKGPAGVVFEDLMTWNVNMWDASTQGLDLVADSIESGNVNQQRVQAINGRLEHLANTGPWTEDTAVSFVKRTIGGIPVIGRIAKFLW